MGAKVSVDVRVTAGDRDAAMRADVREGLASRPRSIPPMWFYDEAGSKLFDEITRLPEYYLTRCERSILSRSADEIVSSARADTLVELGSGTSEKTRLILDAMQASGKLERVVLLDISEEVLQEAAAGIARRYGVPVHAVVGDFRSDLSGLSGRGRQLWAFLGSTIGNFTPTERASMYTRLRSVLDEGDRLLLGTDLVKSPERLVAAYDDAEGVTAQFNLNVLSVLNASLGSDFDPGRFEHVALWNQAERWIEMRLRATEEHSVEIPGLDLRIELLAGEEILTEISAKFDPGGLARELADAGLETVASWRDAGGAFQLTLTGPGPLP
jgi:L-histidine N-alpha-methyltransferase